MQKIISNLKILTLQSQYIFLLLWFACNNKDRYIYIYIYIYTHTYIHIYTQNLDIHGRNTRYGSDLHFPTSNLAIYHKRIYYMCLKAFNSLSSYIKFKLQDIKEFK